jgi:hypothetical protein
MNKSEKLLQLNQEALNILSKTEDVCRDSKCRLEQLLVMSQVLLIVEQEKQEL